eukprot:3026599-Lingulodinium_polyedra.AAC.1
MSFPHSRVEPSSMSSDEGDVMFSRCGVFPHPMALLCKVTLLMYSRMFPHQAWQPALNNSQAWQQTFQTS